MVIRDACGPLHNMCFRLFMVTSIYSIRTRTINGQKLGETKKVTEDSRLKRERNRIDK